MKTIELPHELPVNIEPLHEHLPADTYLERERLGARLNNRVLNRRPLMLAVTEGKRNVEEYEDSTGN